MKAVILEGRAANPGDISWDPVISLADTTIYDTTTEEQLVDRIAQTDAILVNKLAVTESVFEQFPQIRYVGECATGYNNIDLKAARSHHVTVTNVPAYGTASVVQHTFALLLDLTNKVSLHNASVKAGDWTRSENFCYWKAPIVELDGKTMGIVGFGHIGQGVAHIATAFGMRRLVYTAHPNKYRAYEDETLSFVSLDQLLRNSDVITLHCPLTDENRGLICADTIARMRDGAFLLNLSRGPLVVEQDLAAALTSGKIAAAGVDVIEKEPMRADNPLLTAPHIVITPHIAWASIEARKRLVSTAAANLAAWMDGKPQNVVS